MTAAPTIGLDPAAESAAEPTPELTRDQKRSRRRREVRAVTIPISRMPKRKLALLREQAGDVDALAQRPRTRADCADIPRPCPFVSCQHNLYLDVSPETGAIKLNFPDLEPDQLEQSCALDLAARGGMPLEEVGVVMNVTRERVRQIEERARGKLARRSAGLAVYRDHAHDFDHAEPVAHQLPIVSRAVVEARIAATMPPATAQYPKVAPLVEPDWDAARELAERSPPPADCVVSPEEVPMPICVEEDCNTIVRPGKFKGTPAPGTEGMCRKCAKKHLSGANPTTPARRKAKAVEEPAATTMDVRGLSVADLLEAHQLVQLVGLDLLRAIAVRIQNGGHGT